MRLRSTLLLSLTLAAGLPLRGQIPAMQAANTIGVFRQNPPAPGAPPPGLTNWIVDSNGTHSYAANDAMYWFGLDTDLPIMGDWLGIGHLQMGAFYEGMWFMDSNDNHQWDSGDQMIAWGLPGDIPVVGDWDHTNSLRIGVYRVVGGLGWWYVNLHTCTDSYGCNWGGVSGTAPENLGTDVTNGDYEVFQWGLPGDVPIVGDWDGTGVLRPGVYRPSLGQWIVNLSKQPGCNDYSCAFANGDALTYTYDPLGGQPVVGIWNAGGTLSTGQFLGGQAGVGPQGQWSVQAAGGAQAYSFGLAGDVAMMGPWTIAPLTINTTSLPAGQQGTQYTQALAASGGAPPYTWFLLSGSLPPGISLTSSGTLAGTPTAVGTYNFTVQATDSASRFAIQALSLAIAALVPTVQLSVGYSSATYEVGDTFTITVGGLPNSPVSVDQNGSVYNLGYTNSVGVWSETATWGTANIGSYSQTWFVAGAAASPTLNFNIVANPGASIPNSLTAPPNPLACNDITGSWQDNFPGASPAQWNLTWNGSAVGGNMQRTAFTQCGVTTYSNVSGSLSGNVFTVTASQPSNQYVCLPTYDVDTTVTEAVTVSGPSCSTAAVQWTASGPGEQGAGSSTWQAVHQHYVVSVSSYIPVDHIPGPTKCFVLGDVPTNYGLLYEGDAYRNTYRTTQSILAIPDIQYSYGSYANTGPTRNYSNGSPANGPTANLSSSPTNPNDLYNSPYAGADEDQIQ